jgi:hypothetical protein
MHRGQLEAVPLLWVVKWAYSITNSCITYIPRSVLVQRLPLQGYMMPLGFTLPDDEPLSGEYGL